MNFSRFSSDCMTVVIIGLASVVLPGHARAQKALGTDVSNHQGTGVNWSSCKANGISFAWAKATEGTGFIDADYTYNVGQAKGVGIPIGGYDFALPKNLTPNQEANYFWAEAGPYTLADGLTITPMLDYETFSGYTGASSYGDWANQWCTNIQGQAAAQGVKLTPIIYISACNASELNSSDAVWQSDIANYNDESAQSGTPWSSCAGDDIWGGSSWDVWQYADSNPYSGGDSDVYNGTVAQMTAALVPTSTGIAPADVTLYWDPNASKASPGSGGSGTWALNSLNWWWGGNTNAGWNSGGDNAVFAGAAGTVMLGSAITVGNLTFQTAGYNIALGRGNSSYPITLNSARETISVVGPASNPSIISDPITETGTGYLLTGGGALLLNNSANSVSGNLTIDTNTTLAVASSGALGMTSGTISLGNNAVLQNNDQTAGDAFANSGVGISLPSSGAYLNVNTNGSLTYGGVIGGSGSLTKIGGGGVTGGTLILNGANTYSGNTIIKQGVLALGSSGSINNSPAINIAAGGTFDVSAQPGWTLGGSAFLYASGNGTSVYTNAATIKGAASGTVNLGSEPVSLTYTPAATNGDVSDPALYISQGTLVLSHGNTIAISNASGAAMGAGLYTIIEQASGSISNSPYPTPQITGAGMQSSNVASLTVSGNSVYLLIARKTATTLSPLSASSYGQPVTFTATVAPSPSGGAVQFYDSGTPIGSPVAVSGGTASYTTSTLAVGNHSITAGYGGSTFYVGSTNSPALTQQVNKGSLAITATPQSKVYGTVLNFGSGSTNFSSAGLAGGDTVGSVTLAVSGNGGAASAPVGTYTITPSAATGGTFTAGNYTITYNPGTLTVTLPPNSTPVSITSATVQESGAVQLNFSGTPGYVYWIEAATNLNPPVTWTAISTNAADTNGLFNFTDLTATNFSVRYYRTHALPPD